jgi:hypothetical protein
MPASRCPPWHRRPARGNRVVPNRASSKGALPAVFVSDVTKCHAHRGATMKMPPQSMKSRCRSTNDNWREQIWIDACPAMQTTGKKEQDLMPVAVGLP